MSAKRKLSRKGRIGRNLLCTLLAGVLVWLGLGAPAPTAALALRRLERESFFSPHSQFQGVLETAWWGPWALGLREDWLVFGDLSGGELFYLWPRTNPGEPVVAPQPISNLESQRVTFVAAGAPKGTASAQLTLELSCWYLSPWFMYAQPDRDWQGETPSYWEDALVLEGEPLSAGAFAFQVEIWNSEEALVQNDVTIQEGALWQSVDWRLYQGYYLPENLPLRCRATAVFYSESGVELGRAELREVSRQEI